MKPTENKNVLNKRKVDQRRSGANKRIELKNNLDEKKLNNKAFYKVPGNEVSVE